MTDIEPLNDSSPDPIAVMIDRAVAGCCGDYAGVGSYCEYHRGYVEGRHAMADEVEWLRDELMGEDL